MSRSLILNSRLDSVSGISCKSCLTREMDLINVYMSELIAALKYSLQILAIMYHDQRQHARSRVGIVRLLLLLALLPLLRLPIPVLHKHGDWLEAAAFSKTLPEHIHHFHHDIDEEESHWHFVQLEDLGWFGMAHEAQQLKQETVSGIFQRECLQNFELSNISKLMQSTWDCVILPPNSWLYRSRELLSLHGLHPSSRTYLVQLLCEQHC